MSEIREHPRLGYRRAGGTGGYPPEMLDVVLHHHEFLDGTGYPDGLRRPVTTSCGDDDRRHLRGAGRNRAYRFPFTHAKAFSIMEKMEGKLDQHLLECLPPGGLRILLSVRGGLGPRLRRRRPNATTTIRRGHRLRRFFVTRASG